MGLPLNLAMTPAEMFSVRDLPEKPAWMACHFSPCGEGLTTIPDLLPAGSMLILNDRMPCQGHSPDLAAHQLADAASRLECESVLLDFQRPPDAESEAMAAAIVHALPCPAAAPAHYAKTLGCPVFLPPAPLHIPLEDYLRPYTGQEIWLEAALCQEAVIVTSSGTEFSPQLPPDGFTGGFYDEALCCRYLTKISPDEVRFTLFDTLETLPRKLERAQALGVTRAVGLFQQLG